MQSSLDCLSSRSHPGAVWGDESDPGADLISTVPLVTFKPAPREGRTKHRRQEERGVAAEVVRRLLCGCSPLMIPLLLICVGTAVCLLPACSPFFKLSFWSNTATKFWSCTVFAQHLFAEGGQIALVYYWLKPCGFDTSEIVPHVQL